MVRSGVRRLSAGLADQAATSLTSLCVSVAALRGPTDGAAEFAVVFIAYTLAVGFCRSITTEPAAPELPGAAEERVRGHVRAAGLTGLLVGLGAALLTAALLRPDTALGLWSLALPLTAVPLDSVRAAWIGARRAPRAVPLSAAQLAAGAGGLVLTLLTGTSTWAVVPVVAVSGLLVLAALLAPAPRVPVRQLRPVHWIYSVEWALTFGVAQSSALVLASLGLPLLPLLLRAQGVLFGPLSSLAQAVAALAVPEFVSLRARRPTLLSAALGLSGLLVGASALYALVVLLVPDALLEALLGDTWARFAPVLPLAALAVVVVGAAMGPLVAMRALGAARTSLVCRVVMGVAGLALPLPAALLWGVGGFFAASAAGSVAGGAWSLLALRRLERAPVAESAR